MKKINWKIFNLSLLIELLLAYVLPFKVLEDFEYQSGFPFSFISIYASKIGTRPINSMYLNPFVFILNCFIIYFIIIFLTKVIKNFKK
ncbi:MAG: hypothetical protein R3Y12_08810 [Clostridia bacterium]